MIFFFYLMKNYYYMSFNLEFAYLKKLSQDLVKLNVESTLHCKVKNTHTHFFNYIHYNHLT